MRKWILNLHLYGGLLCAPYLIIFGFSSLHFNHHFAFVSGSTPEKIEWECPLTVQPSSDRDAMGQAVRDDLALIGWPVPWRTKQHASGDWEIAIERPGKSYVVHTQLGEHRARVEERRKNVWQVINSLHALHAVPNSAFATWWGVYTEFCAVFVLFAAVSGIYLWATSRRERWAGAITLGAAGLLAVGLMCFVYLRG